MNIDNPSSSSKMKVDRETFELYMKTGIWSVDQFEIIETLDKPMNSEGEELMELLSRRSNGYILTPEEELRIIELENKLDNSQEF